MLGEYSCSANANKWIERWLGECIYTTWDTAAYAIGLSSIWFWLIAQLPQFISNFMRSAADALSPWFLAQWLLGDSFNFLGCILTGDQLKTQVITAGYFIFSDVVIISQYVYYQVRNKEVLDFDDSIQKGSLYSRGLKCVYSKHSTCDESSTQELLTCNGYMQSQQTPIPETLTDIQQQDCWIHDHQYRLRRLTLEYNLEYGQSMTEHLTSVYNKHKKRFNRGHSRRAVANSTSTNRVPYRAVLGIIGFFGMMSISKLQLFSMPCKLQCIRGSTASSRRALLALGEGVIAGENLALSKTSQRGAAYFTGKIFSHSQQTYPWAHMIGALLGWCSSALYLGSRLSQLIKNKQRQSAEGLSLGMVTCAVLANITYGVSIIMRSSSWDDLISKAPWLVGSCGTVFLDLSIFIQAYYYRGHSKKYEPLLS